MSVAEVPTVSSTNSESGAHWELLQQLASKTQNLPYLEGEYQVLDLREQEEIKDRFFSILNDPTFVVLPHRTNSDRLYHPTIVSQKNKEEVIELIAKGDIGQTHMEAVVSMIPSAIPHLNYKNHPISSYESDPQVDQSRQIADQMKKHPHNKELLGVFQEALSVLNLDRSALTENRAFQDIPADVLGIILRDFVINRCTNAYTFYELLDLMREKYVIEPDSNEERNLRHAAYFFSELVYAEQNKWAIAGRKLILEGKEKSRILNIEQSLHISTSEGYPVTDILNNGLLSGDIENEQDGEVSPMESNHPKIEEFDKLGKFTLMGFKKKTVRFLEKINFFLKKKQSHNTYA
ncbi:MAG TPA: hypothetical protein VLF89_09605 [Candidatus Saccharimonadales bacterium]|nr:hypothetical protein [Candidatus Saccharimonadales bacterium]